MGAESQLLKYGNQQHRAQNSNKITKICLSSSIFRLSYFPHVCCLKSYLSDEIIKKIYVQIAKRNEK